MLDVKENELKGKTFKESELKVLIEKNKKIRTRIITMSLKFLYDLDDYLVDVSDNGLKDDIDKQIEVFI